MSARLTASFRGWVRWYPASWRAANADAMLGVYLDVAEGERREELTAGEKRSLAMNGLATRLTVYLSARVRDGVATGAVALLGALGVVLSYYEWSAYLQALGRLSNCGQGVFPMGCAPLSFTPLRVPMGLIALAAVVVTALAFVSRAALTRWALILLGFVSIAVIVASRVGLISDRVEHPAVPFAFIALMSGVGLLGRATRRSALGLALLAWLAVFALADVVVLRLDPIAIVRDSKGASVLFAYVINRMTIAWGIAGGLLIAIILLAARRVDASLVFVLSTLPWLALWLYDSEKSPYILGGIGEVPGECMSTGYLIVGVLFIVRAVTRRDNRKNSAPA